MKGCAKMPSLLNNRYMEGQSLTMQEAEFVYEYHKREKRKWKRQIDNVKEEYPEAFREYICTMPCKKHFLDCLFDQYYKHHDHMRGLESQLAEQEWLEFERWDYEQNKVSFVRRI
jgi:hypothetical protein